MFEKKLGRKIGRGSEKEVYINQENPDHVIGVFHEDQKETPYKVKGRFYLTKILHLLFPKNIPDVHLAATDPHLIEIDRVEVDNSVSNRELLENKDKKALYEKTLDLGALLDYHYSNFGYDQEGNLVYLDSVDPWVVGSRYVENKCLYDPEKIRVALEKLENDKKEHGLVFLNRLEELYREELASIPKVSQETKNEEAKRIERNKQITLDIKNSWSSKYKNKEGNKEK